MNEDAEVLFERRGVAGIVTLNRPKALNALTLGMVRLIHPQLTAWADDDGVQVVIVQGAGDRAFCAGGDIRALHDWGKAHDSRVIDFYREEYRLNTYIKEYPKSYIALMDGIDMGGGVGLSVHAGRRIATERLVFAMPETGIGLFPDVGGTYFLPRCPGQIGMYLALTGARLKAADALYAGIADDYVPSDKLDDLIEALAGGTPIDEAVKAVSAKAGPPSLGDIRAEIDVHFVHDSVAEIIVSLHRDAGDWCMKTADTIMSKSPLSTRIAFRQVREGAELNFRDCMRLEFRLTNRFMAGQDFYEGVRAVVIDKDQSPQWVPSSLDAVSDAMVDAYFADLGDQELSFD